MSFEFLKIPAGWRERTDKNLPFKQPDQVAEIAFDSNEGDKRIYFTHHCHPPLGSWIHASVSSQTGLSAEECIEIFKLFSDWPMAKNEEEARKSYHWVNVVKPLNLSTARHFLCKIDEN